MPFGRVAVCSLKHAMHEIKGFVEFVECSFSDECYSLCPVLSRLLKPYSNRLISWLLQVAPIQIPGHLLKQG